MFKRIALFIGTNLLVIATISIITNVLGLHHYLTAHGLDYQSLAIFCLIWGCAGSFISLLLSKFMAKMAMGVVTINLQSASPNERALVDIVYSLARKAGLSTMPEVGIYHSPELNAFATGPSRNHSLVAVSSGLLNHMNRDELEAVLGHEIAHVANGDMVTMTLIQGIVNAFALFLSRIIAYGISVALAKDDEKGGISHLTNMVLTLIFDIIFTLLGSILVAAFSRWREFRADQGGARLAGRDKMIAALKRLSINSEELIDDRAPSLAALKISHPGGFIKLFATHPPLEQRIKRLQQGII